MLEEFAAAEFGDVRLTKRLLRIVEVLGPDPSASFPNAARTEAELEGMYRFFGNQSVTPQRILTPHVALTAERARAAGRVVVAHDTTEFGFSGPREGLGKVNDTGQGFFAHCALAVELSNDGMRRRPLGVLGLQALTRTGPARRNHHTERIAPEQRESFRWNQLVDHVQDALGDEACVVHVMDSEADAYGLLAHMVARGARFVVRSKHDRNVITSRGEQVKLNAELPTVDGQFVREVELSLRNAAHRERSGRKRNLARQARSATLEFAATRVTFRRPKYDPSAAETLTLNVVHVRELNAPDGMEPVDWKLYTTEPIGQVADIEAIVDMYRARWLIEELFKALKTGCAFEKRQLESLPALLNALAVLMPLAYSLLLLRNLARDDPDSPATQLFPALHLLILKRLKATMLAPDPTVHQAMLAVARLGGHIKSNGAPGWIVLGRGYEKLLALAQGAALIMTCDQS